MASILKSPLPEYIIALERENRRMREALKPFAKAAKIAETDEPDSYSLYGSSARHGLTIGDLKKAAETLSSDQREIS